MGTSPSSSPSPSWRMTILRESFKARWTRLQRATPIGPATSISSWRPGGRKRRPGNHSTRALAGVSLVYGICCFFPCTRRVGRWTFQAKKCHNRRRRACHMATVSTQKSGEKLLTPAEVAALFRVDPKTVTRWAKAGKLSSIRTLGGHRRYRADEVRKFLEGARQQTRAE